MTATTSLKKPPTDIRNKIKRQDVILKYKQSLSREKLQRRLKQKKEEKANPALKEERLATNIPQTLELLRENDETIVEEDEEVLEEEESDEFAGYFQQGLAPKVLITTSRRPSAHVYNFANEFTTIFPGATFVKRGSQFEVKRIVEIAIEREYTDVMIINEDRKEPSKPRFVNACSTGSSQWDDMLDAVTVIHLPNGPTAHFKLTSIWGNKDIRNHASLTDYTPELILNNFSTRLGHTVGRMFASLFPQVPEFHGRQVVTFHNQRDFIFFRRHRYIFREGNDGAQERCDIQEIGPRFTLKLQWLQKGTFDTRFGEYEWMHKPELDTSRRKFHL